MYIDKGDSPLLMRAFAAGRAVKREPIAVESMPAEPDPPPELTRREKLIKGCREYLAAQGIEAPPPCRTNFPSLALINTTVRQWFGINHAEFISKRRVDSLVRPRQIAMYLATVMAPHASLPMIGRRLGGFHHTTVIHGVERIEAKLQTNEDMRLIVDNLKSRIMQRFEEQRGCSNGMV